MLMTRDNRGYTLVELIIAIAIFSLAMVSITAGIIQLYHIYESGNEIRNTQQAARYIIEQMSRDARTSTVAVSGVDSTSGYTYLCLLAPSAIGDKGLTATSTYAGQRYRLSLNSSTKVVSMFREQISTNFPSNTSATPTAGTCLGAAPSVVTVVGSPQQLTANTSTSIDTFTANTASDPSLLAVTLTVASAHALDSIDTSTTPHTCIGRDQYCSLSTVSTSIASQPSQPVSTP